MKIQRTTAAVLAILGVLAGAIFATTAEAGDVWWIQGAGMYDWNDPANWNDGWNGNSNNAPTGAAGVPVNGDTVRWSRLGSPVTIDVRGDVVSDGGTPGDPSDDIIDYSNSNFDFTYNGDYWYIYDSNFLTATADNPPVMTPVSAGDTIVQAANNSPVFKANPVRVAVNVAAS